MPKRIKLRTLTSDELAELMQLSSLPTEKRSTALHARVILEMYENPDITADEAGQRVGFTSNVSGSIWLKRFHEKGVAGLENIPRGERRSWYRDEVHQALIALALTRPDTLGYPNHYWTLQQLQNAFEERQGIKLNPQTIGYWLAKAGFPWNRQADWHDAAALAVPLPPKPKRQKTSGIVSSVYKKFYRGAKYSELTDEERRVFLSHNRELRTIRVQAMTPEDHEKRRANWREKYKGQRDKKKRNKSNV